MKSQLRCETEPAALGVVESVPSGTKTDVKEGTRIIGQPWGVGTWQEFAAVDADKLVRMTSCVSSDTHLCLRGDGTTSAC